MEKSLYIVNVQTFLFYVGINDMEPIPNIYKLQSMFPSATMLEKGLRKRTFCDLLHQITCLFCFILGASRLLGYTLFDTRIYVLPRRND